MEVLTPCLERKGDELLRRITTWLVLLTLPLDVYVFVRAATGGPTYDQVEACASACIADGKAMSNLGSVSGCQCAALHPPRCD